MWHDNRLPRSMKLRLYAASVCSTLTHGGEAWTLTTRTLVTLNGFNSRQLTRMHHWLGHILRMPTDCAGPTSWTAIPTWQPPDRHAPPPTRTSPAIRRPPRMGTRWPIPLLTAGKPLRGETPQIIIISRSYFNTFIMNSYSI